MLRQTRLYEKDVPQAYRQKHCWQSMIPAAVSDIYTLIYSVTILHICTEFTAYLSQKNGRNDNRRDRK